MSMASMIRRVLRVAFKVVVFGCLGLVLALAGLSAFFYIAGRDIDPPDVSDLLPPAPPPIEPSENMVPVLMDATNCLALANIDKALINSYRKEDWNHKLNLDHTNCVALTEQDAAALADRILATNAALFAALDVAVTRPRAQYPAGLEVRFVVPESFETPVYSILWSFEDRAWMYGALVALRARRLRENGCSAEAVEELLRYGEMFARLSYKIESPTCILSIRSPNSLVVDELVKAVVKDDLADDICVRIDEACTRWAQMRLEALEKDSAYLIWRVRNTLARDRGLTFEQYFPDRYFEIPSDWCDCKWAEKFSDGLKWAVKSFPGYGRYAFQPNRSLAEWASAWREAKPIVIALPYTVETRTRLSEMEKAYDKQFHPLRRNCVGSYELASYKLAAAWRCYGRIAFYNDSYRVVIAAARYRRKHGSLPPTLDALVPEFLAEVPRDPYDASRPLGYDVEQGTIHTVGADGAFDGKIPKPNARYGGLRGERYRCIRRIDGRQVGKQERRNGEKVIARMKALRLPKIAFAPPNTLGDALSFLAEATRSEASDAGFAFMIKRGDLLLEDGEEPVTVGSLVVPKIEASDISIYDALRLVCDAVDCKWNVEGGVIVVRPMCAGDYPDDWITRTYTGVGLPVRDWTHWVEANGVKLPEGTSILHSPESMQLRVSSTREIVERIEKLLKSDVDKNYRDTVSNGGQAVK